MIKEYFSVRSEETIVKIEDSQIKMVNNKNIVRKSVRVFDEDKKILALAAAVGNIPDAELEEKAKSLLSLNMPYNYELEKDTQGKFVKDKCNVNPETLATEALKDLKEYTKDFVFDGNSATYKVTNTLRNSLGLDLSLTRGMLRLGFTIRQKGSGNIMDTGNGFGYFDLTDERYQQFLKNTDFVCKACQSEKVALENKPYKVLMNYSYLLRKFLTDITAIPYEEKSSLLAGKLGTQVFHESVNINDCYDIDDLVVYIPYDHEGIVAKAELPVIENGVLKNILYDKKTAQKYGKTTTGNGFRNYNSNPAVYNKNLVFKNVERLTSELIADEYVIVPYISSGGDFLPNGNYSLPIQMGFVFKNGKFIGKTPQLTITGNYVDSLSKDLIGLSKNDVFKELLEETLVLSEIVVSIN
jgi:PmbA protein